METPPHAPSPFPLTGQETEAKELWKGEQPGRGANGVRFPRTKKVLGGGGGTFSAKTWSCLSVVSASCSLLTPPPLPPPAVAPCSPIKT